MDTTATVILGAGLAFFLITCMAIIDAAQRDFGSIEKKAIWIFFLAMVPFAGVACYMAFGYRKGKKTADA